LIVKRFLKWLGFVVVGITGIAALGFTWLYFASERELAREYTVREGPKLVIPTDASEVAEGKRIAQLAGCQHCHGDDLTGGVVDDIPNLVRLVAPNISVMLPDYTDEQLATMLRQGVKRDGTSVLFMPSEMFRHLDDRDLARVIAWVRTVTPTAEGVNEKTELRPLARFLLVKGDFNTAARVIPSLPAPASDHDANDPPSHGRYLTMNLCSECHGQSLEGFPPIAAPPLTVAKGYSLEQFERLMREGRPLVGREMKIMGVTSRVRFSHLREDEVAAIHAYLHSR
jgi:cytochrome c553